MARPLRSCHSVMPFSALYQENATAATSAQWNSRVGRSQTCTRTVSSPRAMLSGLLHERRIVVDHRGRRGGDQPAARSEEHTSELQSLMRISYAVFCLKQKKKQQTQSDTSAH